jgi:primosomal protein N' (replication factor Y)
MYYYEVAPATVRYQGHDYLTYHFTTSLNPGQIVIIELRQQRVYGIVTRVVAKPSFKTKPLDEVVDLPPLPAKSLQLFEWFRVYYPSPLGLLTEHFLPPNFTKLDVAEVKKSPKKPATLPPLTNEQTSVLKKIKEGGSFLLHGETGSGKTRVYLEVAQQMLAQGRSALVLTPEISLTPQLVKSFSEKFAGHVITIHSNLTAKERREAWLQIHKAEGPKVIIGPRSALFAPLKSKNSLLATWRLV